MLDVKGSSHQANDRLLTDETGGLGHPVSLNYGSTATVTAFATGTLTVGGLTGMTANAVGTLLSLRQAGIAGNNGVFVITAYNSVSSVSVADVNGYYPDPKTGFIDWYQWNSGNTATIATWVDGLATITGGANFTANSVGNFITITNAATPGNNGTFLITAYNSSTSVSCVIAGGTAPDYGVGGSLGSGTVNWIERYSYSLNDDLDFERSDRSYIKGVNYDQPVPSYTRPDLALTAIPKNLSNIYPLDEKLLNVNRLWYSAAVASTNTKITLSTSPLPNLPHASTSNLTGIPCFDVAPYVGDYTSCGVSITNATTGADLYVLAGAHAGEKIFGVTNNGASTAPTSVEVVFYSVPIGSDPSSSSTAYTWEAGQPTSINLVYGYGERGDMLDLNCLRSTPALGIISDAALQNQINNIYSYDGTTNGLTNISSVLTNKTAYYPFSYLGGGAADTVVAALNILNSQIGNDTFSGPQSIITSGNTITQSLQNLANAIGSSGVTRYIERLSTNISANVSHLLPGNASYTQDGTNNGKGLAVFWRGILRDPGTVATGDDYAETDTTHITPYSKWNQNDHVNYWVI
jgi:hypothetical protein